MSTGIGTVIEELQRLLGERVDVSPSAREHHSQDESSYPPAPPDAVVWPHTAEEISSILRVCSRTGTPVVPFGAGTSLEGHVLAAKGGVCLDFTEMNDILRVSADDLDVTVQPGVTRLQLEERLKRDGLFFPVDPGADATIGGMVATRASGTNAVRYGTMRDNVLGLQVVLADGRVIRTGTRARKSSAGYDLTRLFVGSEGTLGVITEITLRAYGIPEAMSSAICAFDTIDKAVRTVISTIQLGIPVARIELLDEVQMRAVNNHSGLSYKEAPTLFLEFHGSERSVSEDARAVAEIASEFGGDDFQWATKTEDRNRLWKARHDAYYASMSLRPGGRAITTDVCVPISRLSECIAQTKRELEGATMPITLVGHVGDGNFHLMFMLDPDNENEFKEAKEANRRLVALAQALGGTCTGEHGVGMGKREFLVDEHGRDAVDVMASIKHTLDPLSILNPGKLLPE